jgi:DNA primase
MIVSFDADKPGIKAAERAISLCFEKGVQIRVLNLPQGLDPDSFINKFGVEKYRELSQKSTPGLKFLIDTQLQAIKEKSPEEKAQIAKNIVSEIEKIPDSVVRSEYLKQTSEQLSIDEDVLRSMIKRKSTEEKELEKGIFLNAEKRLLQILLEEKEIAPYIFAEIKEEYFQDLKSKPIFNALSESFRKGKSSSLHELKQKVDATLVSSLSKAMLEKEQNATVEEAFECLNTLKQLSLENLAKKLNAELTQLEKKGEKEKILPLIKQIQDTKKELSILSKRNYQNLSYNNRDGIERERD